MSNSNAASSAQALFEALLELRRLGPAGVFSGAVSMAAKQGHAQASEELARNSVSQASAQSVPKIAPQSESHSAPKSAVSSLRAVYADKRVGERFEFGRYPQETNDEVMPIVWRVLRRDSDALLIIAEKVLDCKPYHETWTDITWAECSLRRWLNAAFYNRAFNDQERALILQTYVINNAGPDTADHVFLLSINDAKRLFADDAARQAVPTDFALEKGARTSADFNIGNIGCCCWWWLRSRGFYDDLAADVGTDGGVYEAGSDVNDDCGCVRPALRIAL